MTETPATPEVVITQGAPAITATIDPNATPAPAAEDTSDLLAGKFKTQEDLIKGYEELQKKLGSNVQPPANETPATPETPATADENSSETPDENPYGEAVTNALKSADITLEDVQKEYTDNEGKLSDASYEALNKAGFPQAVVESYLRGVEAASADVNNAEAAVEADIATIKGVAGGDEKFADLQKWIGTNATDAEKTAYNDAVSSGDVTKASAAVQGMSDRQRADTGVEPELLGGQPPAAEAGYASEAAWLEAVADPRYKSSQAYRDAVSAKLAKSPNVMVTR